MAAHVAAVASELPQYSPSSSLHTLLPIFHSVAQTETGAAGKRNQDQTHVALMLIFLFLLFFVFGLLIMTICTSVLESMYNIHKKSIKMKGICAFSYTVYRRKGKAISYFYVSATLSLHAHL